MSSNAADLAVGMDVEWEGRSCVLRGFDPMGVSDRRAELEDVETGERFQVPLDELRSLLARPG